MNKNKERKYIFKSILEVSFFMGRKSKFTKEIKLQAVNDYLNYNKSTVQIAYDLQCDKSSVRSWIHGFKSQGESFFDNKTVNKSYSKKLKLQVVNEYLTGTCSLLDLVNKYKLSSKEVVRNWVLMYNKGKELKEYNFNPEVYKMKARKTTFEERIEIVKYCLENNKDYSNTAFKYTIPYSLIYQWVKRYESEGEVALGYTRKGPKSKSTTLEHEDPAQAEIERLKKELAKKELEIEILKKKQYFEKIIYSQKSDK